MLAQGVEKFAFDPKLRHLGAGARCGDMLGCCGLGSELFT